MYHLVRKICSESCTLGDLIIIGILVCSCINPSDKACCDTDSRTMTNKTQHKIKSSTIGNEAVGVYGKKEVCEATAMANLVH